MVGAQNQPSAENESGGDECDTKKEVRDGQQSMTCGLEDLVKRVEGTQVSQKRKPAENVADSQCYVAGGVHFHFREFIARRQSQEAANYQDNVITANYQQITPF